MINEIYISANESSYNKVRAGVAEIKLLLFAVKIVNSESNPMSTW